MFIGVWIVAVPIFLLFGAGPKDIFNIFITTVITILILSIYTNIWKRDLASKRQKVFY